MFVGSYVYVCVYVYVNARWRKNTLTQQTCVINSQLFTPKHRDATS